jgi:hypothetical protein
MMRILLLCCLVLACGKSNPYKGGTRLELAFVNGTSAKLDLLEQSVRARMEEKGATFDVKREGARVIVQLSPDFDADMVGIVRELLVRVARVELRWVEPGRPVISGIDVGDAEFTYEGSTKKPKRPSEGGQLSISVDDHLRHVVVAQPTVEGLVIFPGDDGRGREIEALLKAGALPPVKVVEEKRIE